MNDSTSAPEKAQEQKTAETFQTAAEAWPISEKNDCTAYPWWGIVTKAGLGKLSLECGPFASREAAEQKRTSRIYHYSEKSFVYCFSGHDSWDYRKLHDAVRAEQKAKAPAPEVQP